MKKSTSQKPGATRTGLKAKTAKPAPKEPGDKFPQGRKTKLTPERATIIVNAIRAGNFINVAASFANLPSATVYEWIAIGEGRDKNRPKREPFASFAASVKKAEADAEVASLQRIRQAGQGNTVARETTRTVVKERKTGEVETSTTTDKYFNPPQWQADAWYLERKHNDRWGKKDQTTLKNAPGEEFAIGGAAHVPDLIAFIYGNDESRNPGDATTETSETE